jgi:hypothetical protein
VIATRLAFTYDDFDRKERSNIRALSRALIANIVKRSRNAPRSLRLQASFSGGFTLK